MSDLKEKIKLAYKKLKSAVYYDKNQLILRNKIVDYEKKLDFSNEKIDKKLEKIIEVLKSDKEEIWTSYIKKNLDKIDTHYFPKKIKNKNKSEDIIINKYSQDIVLTEVQKFIDINVESQILGILWVMTVGEVLDEEIYENSYGNRLKKTIDIKNKKDIIEEDKSPRLFSPYFLQYEKWRNNALEVAENILKNNQDAIILTWSVV